MDTRDINAQNLLFLLSAAPLSIGCVVTGDDSATTITTTSGPTSTSGMTSTATDNDTDNQTSNATSSTTAGPDDTTMGPDDTTMGPDDTTSGTTGPAGTLCEEYATLNADCYGKEYYDPYLELCENYTADLESYMIDGCVEAYEEYLACLTGLDCREFMGKEPCMAENVAFGDICFQE